VSWILFIVFAWFAYETGVWRGEVLQNRRWIARLIERGFIEALDVAGDVGTGVDQQDAAPRVPGVPAADQGDLPRSAHQLAPSAAERTKQHYQVGGFDPTINGYRCVCGGSWSVSLQRGAEPIHRAPYRAARPATE
jgi:uncharacterized Zn-binding protein involved in type VI secretion